MMRPGGYRGWCSVNAMELSFGWAFAFRAEVRCCVVGENKFKLIPRQKEFFLFYLFHHPLSEGSSSSFATGPSTVFTQSATLTSPPLTHLFIRVNVGILARHFRDGSRLRTTATAEHGAGDCFPLQGTEKHRETHSSTY